MIGLVYLALLICAVTIDFAHVTPFGWAMLGAAALLATAEMLYGEWDLSRRRRLGLV